jgi:probable HAF family extracellular repeat protein
MRPSYFCLTGLLLSTLILTLLAPAQTVQYKVFPVYSPFNSSDVEVSFQMNNAGTVPLTDYTSGQAFMYKSGKSTSLSLLGGTCSSAKGINQAGHIVGGACLPSETVPHAYIYRKTGAVDLGTFGGISAEGVQVNYLDQVTGTYNLSDGTTRAFFSRRHGSTDLGSLGGSFIYSFDLNRDAVITGQSDISNTPDPTYGIPPFHGFQWSNGVLTDFGAIFGSNFNYGSGINNAGVIAGSADTAGDTGAHAILWNQGSVQDLSPYPGISAAALNINNQGAAVGIWGSVDPNPADGPPVNVVLCPCYAVLWQNGSTIFLNDVVPPGWDLLVGISINDRGEILARGRFNNGFTGLVLLKPLPQATGQLRSGSQAVTTDERLPSANEPRAIRRLPDGSFREIPRR